MALSLHDIRDCEAHIASRLQTLPAFQALSVHDREDAMQEMLVMAYQLSETYSPTMGFTFSTMLGRQIPNRFVDYLRKQYGDSRYERTRQLERLAYDYELEEDEHSNSLFDVAVYDELEDEIPEVDTEQLSERGLETFLTYALPMRKGLHISDLSELHSESVPMIRKRLRELQQELDDSPQHHSWQR